MFLCRTIWNFYVVVGHREPLWNAFLNTVGLRMLNDWSVSFEIRSVHFHLLSCLDIWIMVSFSQGKIEKGNQNVFVRACQDASVSQLNSGAYFPVHCKCIFIHNKLSKVWFETEVPCGIYHVSLIRRPLASDWEIKMHLMGVLSS